MEFLNKDFYFLVEPLLSSQGQGKVHGLVKLPGPGQGPGAVPGPGQGYSIDN